jgi:hypothetical protein
MADPRFVQCRFCRCFQRYQEDRDGRCVRHPPDARGQYSWVDWLTCGCFDGVTFTGDSVLSEGEQIQDCVLEWSGRKVHPDAT